jgi:hypothetical protein
MENKKVKKGFVKIYKSLTTPLKRDLYYIHTYAFADRMGHKTESLPQILRPRSYSKEG